MSLTSVSLAHYLLTNKLTSELLKENSNDTLATGPNFLSLAQNGDAGTGGETGVRCHAEPQQYRQTRCPRGGRRRARIIGLRPHCRSSRHAASGRRASPFWMECLQR